LGSESIGYCEKTVRKNMCLILNGYVVCQRKSTGHGNEDTEIADY